VVRKSPPRLALPLALRPGNGWFPLKKRSRYARGRTPDENKDDSHEIPLPRGRGRREKSKGGEKKQKMASKYAYHSSGITVRKNHAKHPKRM